LKAKDRGAPEVLLTPRFALYPARHAKRRLRQQVLTSLLQTFFRNHIIAPVAAEWPSNPTPAEMMAGTIVAGTMFQNFMCTSRKKRIAEGQQISFDSQGATSNVDVMFMCAMFIYLSARENGRDLASPVRTDVARPAACEPVTSAFGGKRPSFVNS